MSNLRLGDTPATLEKSYTAEQLAGMALTPIYQQDFPKAGAYALSSVAPGFSSNNGWFMVRFNCTTLPTAGAAQYPLTIHDGGTTNVIGCRVNNAATVVNSLNVYFRVSSVTKTAEGGQYPVFANEVKTAIFVWRDDGYQYLIIDDTLDYSTQTGARGMSLTTLQIGGRNGGADALVGSVIYAEVGNTYITPAQAAARMAQIRKPLVIEYAGQSNASEHFQGLETTTAQGRNGLVGVLSNNSAAYCPGEVVLVNGAEGGSSIFQTIDPVEYWLTDGGGIGPELGQFFEYVDKTGHVPDFVMWDQGEADSHFIDHASYTWLTQARYKEQLLRVFTHMRNKFPNVQILLGVLGRRTSAFTNTGGIQKIVDVQNELINEYPWIHFGYTRHDLTLYSDGTHYTDASYATMGARLGRSIQRVMGYPVTGTLGPRMVSATRVGTALTITIEHDAGTDFTPTTSIEGFKYIDGSGNDVALSSVARASATTITATLASGVAGTLYHIYDSASTVTTANMVKDNSTNTMPLRRGKVTVT